MRPTANILDEGDTLPFLNATFVDMYLKKGNTYTKATLSPIRIAPVFRTDVVKLNGVVIIQEEFDEFTFAKANDAEKIPLERKILIVPDAVFNIHHDKLSELRKILGIAGVAIPEVFTFEGDKMFVEALKVKLF